MHEAASWVGFRLVPDARLTFAAQNHEEHDPRRSGEWGGDKRQGQGGSPWHKHLRQADSIVYRSSKCVIPTNATPVTMQPDFPINFIIPLSHQIDQYKARSSLLDNWPRVRRNETPSGYLQLRTFWDDEKYLVSISSVYCMRQMYDSSSLMDQNIWNIWFSQNNDCLTPYDSVLSHFGVTHRKLAWQRNWKIEL